MFAVAVTFAIDVNQWDQFLSLIAENAESSLHDEPGCQRFDICTDPDRAGEVFLYEVYDDEAAFEAHLATPHVTRFNKAAGAMVRFKDVRTYRHART